MLRLIFDRMAEIGQPTCCTVRRKRRGVETLLVAPGLRHPHGNLARNGVRRVRLGDGFEGVAVATDTVQNRMGCS
jgi:hypothetical protein